ncbi:hypothetical protein MXD62_19495 [Frankia sp. Mgl5]|uniref:hypothetical protein n=1 Tax=Frankia sp. Mgl5 TaxID=2933793 RepID=UPI00201001FF|nr:hypothetical protein [Frankia sp. Mgl5]MCK9929337.1 hypothetical protein [Frankia sp. Mgl5]
MTDDQSTGTDQGTAAGSSDAGRTFTQADLDRIAAREKAQGRKAAEQAFADQLGVSVTEAADIIKAHQQRADADKSEIQRATEAREQALRDADTARAEATQARHAAAVERALLVAGVALPEAEADRDTALARVARLVDAEPGADTATIAAAVAGVKTQFPGLFGQRAAAGGAAGDPGPGPRGGGQGGGGGIAAGIARAQQAAEKRPAGMTLEGTRPVFDYRRT